MSKDFTVHIHGFKSLEEAEEFCQWYSGQGEQDASIWFECRKDEGKDVRSFIPCESITVHPIDDSVVMHVRK